jgi:TRAP-type C4-dicarboxylate transport system permease small subunit
MIAVTTLQIVCRIFFDAPHWSESSPPIYSSRHPFSARRGLQKRSHIAVTFLVNNSLNSSEKPSPFFVQCLACFSLRRRLYGAELMKSEAMQTTPAMGISMTWIYVMYPVIGGIILLHLLAGFGDILGRR